MKKEQADQIALRLAEHIISAHHQYLFSQTPNSEKIADEVVSLVEELSKRLQHSTID